jgi:hypothetical protein
MDCDKRWDVYEPGLVSRQMEALRILYDPGGDQFGGYPNGN